MNIRHPQNSVLFFQNIDFAKPCLSCSPSSVSPFGFVLKPIRLVHMSFNTVMADSCQKSFFKTSISRRHANRVLHSRFPPSGLYKPTHCVKKVREARTPGGCSLKFARPGVGQSFSDMPWWVPGVKLEAWIFQGRCRRSVASRRHHSCELSMGS